MRSLFFIEQYRYADFTQDYDKALLDLLSTLTKNSPRDFIQRFADVTHVVPPWITRMNNQAADLILESCQKEDREMKLKILDEAEVKINDILLKFPLFGQALQNLGTVQYEKGLLFSDTNLLEKISRNFQTSIGSA